MMRKTFLIRLLGLTFLAILVVCPCPAAVEYVIVSGGPALQLWEKHKTKRHDIYWGNFVDSAGVKLGQLKAQATPDDKITWLVFRPSYQRRQNEQPEDLMGIIKKQADAFGARLFWFDSKEQFIAYLNGGLDRTLYPIASLDFFGHSNKVNWMFDYSNMVDGCSVEFFHTRDLTRLNKGIFHPDAVAHSWGCHSGEYHSKKFMEATGVPMWGAIGKTDYSRGGLPVPSQADGKWSQ